MDAKAPPMLTTITTAVIGVLRISARRRGYVSVLLDGVWLRAPYLHNGSVPTLADLLEPPDKRPKLFWRGYDVYDQEKIGFITMGPEAETPGLAVRHGRSR